MKKNILKILVVLCSSLLFSESATITLISKDILFESPQDQTPGFNNRNRFHNGLIRYNDTVLQFEMIAITGQSIGFSNRVTGIDLDQKKTVWTRLLPGGIWSVTQAESTAMIVANHMITAIDIVSGKVLWQFDGDKTIKESFSLESKKMNWSQLEDKESLIVATSNTNEISAYDFSKNTIYRLDREGTLLEKITLAKECRGIAQYPIFIKFQYFNDGFILAGDKRILAISRKGTIASSYRYDSDFCELLVSDIADSTGDEAIIGYGKDAVAILDKNLSLLHKTKLRNSSGKIQNIEKQGSDLIIYTDCDIFVCDVTAAVKWHYYDKGGTKISLLGFSGKPMLYGGMIFVPGNDETALVRLCDRIVALDRATGEKTGEYIYDPATGKEGMFTMLNRIMLSLIPGDNSRFYMIANKVETWTDEGTFGLNHMKSTEYEYEFILEQIR